MSSFWFLVFLISGPDFLLELITTDLVTSFQSQKKSIIFEMFVSIIAKLEMFLKVDFKFQFEYFFEVLNFHCLIAGSELNNKCLPSQPGLGTAGGKIGRNFVEILTENTSISNREERQERSHNKLNIPQ